MTLAITERTKEDLLKEKSAIEAELSRREYVEKPFKISGMSGTLVFQKVGKELSIFQQGLVANSPSLKFAEHTVGDLIDWLQMVQGARKFEPVQLNKLATTPLGDITAAVVGRYYSFDYNGERYISQLDSDRELRIRDTNGHYRFLGLDDMELSNIYEILFA